MSALEMLNIPSIEEDYTAVLQLVEEDFENLEAYEISGLEKGFIKSIYTLIEFLSKKSKIPVEPSNFEDQNRYLTVNLRRLTAHLNRLNFISKELTRTIEFYSADLRSTYKNQAEARLTENDVTSYITSNADISVMRSYNNYLNMLLAELFSLKEELLFKGEMIKLTAKMIQNENYLATISRS